LISGRFEFQQIPGKGQREPDGHFTGFFPNSMSGNSNSSVQFAFILRDYPKPEPRTFEEARGLVINDYQDELENRWIEELKVKYPVTINEAVFKTLPVSPKS